MLYFENGKFYTQRKEIRYKCTAWEDLGRGSKEQGTPIDFEGDWYPQGRNEQAFQDLRRKIDFYFLFERWHRSEAHVETRTIRTELQQQHFGTLLLMEHNSDCKPDKEKEWNSIH